MLRVVVDLNVTSVGIFRGLLRHDPAGTIVFLPENRIHCGYNQTKPAAFHHFSGDEQARIEIAFYDFPGLTSLELRPERSSPNAGKFFRRGPLIESPRRNRPTSRLCHHKTAAGPNQVDLMTECVTFLSNA